MANVSKSDLEFLQSKGYYKGADSLKLTDHLEEFIKELKDPDSVMLVLRPAPSTVVNKAKGGMVDKKSKPTKKTKKAGRLAMRGYGIARR